MRYSNVPFLSRNDRDNSGGYEEKDSSEGPGRVHCVTQFGVCTNGAGMEGEELVRCRGERIRAAHALARVDGSQMC
jgi:hypothetical protein